MPSPISLDDKYELEAGPALMSGIQALVRLPIDQKRLDKRQGLHTAGFISGYRGSPLGGYDQQLARAQSYLDKNDIHVWYGLNEDLGATAVWGSQQLGLFPGARFDGAFGLWYGKAPGVDRTGDVFKHANFAGVSSMGGVLAIAGDDHNCKSSTLPSQSEFAFMDAEIPILNPSNIQEVLDYGIYGWAMSRFSGAWSGLIALADTMDSTAIVNVGLDRLSLIQPDFDFGMEGVHIRRGDTAMAKEERLRGLKLPAAKAFIRANGLDKVILGKSTAKLGVIVTGQTARDIYEALNRLGLTPAQAEAIGLSILKIAMPWPLDHEIVRQFCTNKKQILVIEHKRALIEDQLRQALYDLPDKKRPPIEGKRDMTGRPLFPETGSISIGQIAQALFERLPEGWNKSTAQNYFKKLENAKYMERAANAQIIRSPHFCSGCPHNTSTIVPEGSRALAGIGCHYMATFMDRDTDMFSHMGGEGIAWLGQAHLSDENHVFVNLGDGTYSHSGLLAIRAALTGDVNMTYKILYNDAVAMTGGQNVDSGQTVPQITRQLEAEGVKTIVVVTEDINRYANIRDLARSATIYPRARMEEVQDMLRRTPGISVLIYDQICAAEKRRRIKRGKMAAQPVRAFINPEVCEGCGDCSVQSNCLSIEPLETLLGRKRRINQSSCNQDLRCLDGFCPSFVSVIGAENVTKNRPRPSINTDKLLEPELPTLTDQPYNILLSGVGGTGVTTIAAILSMAAHLDGKAASSLDMTGLAQKGGPVLTHLRLVSNPNIPMAARIPPASTDVLIGCDLVVSASGEALALCDSDKTICHGNSDVTPTSEFITDRTKRFESTLLEGRIKKGVANLRLIDAEALAETYLNDALFTNMIMMGMTWQSGAIPISLASIEHAIRLNKAAVEDNLSAFHLGRLAFAKPEQVEPQNTPRRVPKPEGLKAVISDRMERLTLYQNSAYAQKYAALVTQCQKKEAALGLGEDFSLTVARNAYKLMAYKDEYEVARLFANGAFQKRLSETFSGDYKLKFHLAPPILTPKDSQGRPVKHAFGGWMIIAFSILQHFKMLRDTPLDIFGYSAERCTEHELRDSYFERVKDLCVGLNAQTHALAIEIASLPDQIRGFGHVKHAAIIKVKAEEKRLLAKWADTQNGQTNLINRAG